MTCVGMDVEMRQRGRAGSARPIILARSILSRVVDEMLPICWLNSGGRRFRPEPLITSQKEDGSEVADVEKTALADRRSGNLEPRREAVHPGTAGRYRSRAGRDRIHHGQAGRATACRRSSTSSTPSSAIRWKRSWRFSSRSNAIIGAGRGRSPRAPRRKGSRPRSFTSLRARTTRQEQDDLRQAGRPEDYQVGGRRAGRSCSPRAAARTSSRDRSSTRISSQSWNFFFSATIRSSPSAGRRRGRRPE